MNIQIKGCLNCPFHTLFLDSWGEYIEACNLLRHQRSGDYFMDFYKNGNLKSKNKTTLDNCPILNEPINVNLEICK